MTLDRATDGLDDEPEHRAIHRRLCEYAGQRSALDAAECFDLVRAAAHQIERLVAGHAVGDLPDEPAQPDLRSRIVRIELPTEVLALLREARAVIASERGEELGDAELVEALCRQVLDPSNGRDGPPHQIAYRQCQDCKRATQQGAGRELDVRPDVIERAACDARTLGDLEAAAPARATSTVTPRVREQVFARDGGRCTVPGCRAARNLDVHHVIAQADGGPNHLWNVTLLCSGHHAALHAGFLSMVGRAPYEIVVTWPYGAPLPPGIDAATRSDLLAAGIAASSGQPMPDVPCGTRSSFADPVAPRPRQMRVAYRRAVGPPIRQAAARPRGPMRAA